MASKETESSIVICSAKGEETTLDLQTKASIQVSSKSFSDFPLLATCTGNANAVTSATGIAYNTGSSNAVLGVSDGNYARLYETNDRIVLDLTDELSIGETYTIRWRRGTSTSSNPNIVVEESNDNSTWTAASSSPFTLTTQSFYNQNITTSTSTRYVRFTSQNVYDMDLDAISYSNVSCGGAIDGIGNFTCAAGTNEISGTVFEDFDYDGVYDANEYLGLGNILVTATDSLGNTVTTTTAANGTYTLSSLTSSRTYRVEFTNIPSWASSTFHNGDNGTTVQFLQSGNCANLGLASSSDYCEANPTLFTPCYINGRRSSSPNKDALVAFPYTSTGTTTPPSHSTYNDIGSTWGVAVNPETQTVFTAAFLKRHSDLGPAGLGGIYAIPYTGSALLPVSATHTVANVGTVPSRDLAGLNDYSYDKNVFSEIGKIGLGDIEISESLDTLYVVNLAQKRIEVLNISTFNNTGLGTDISTETPISIPDLGATCDDRPFGLKVYRGKIYVGKVCADDITATVQVYDLSTSTWSIPTNLNEFDISFTRGELHDDQNICNSWNTWEDTFSNFEEKNDGSGSYSRYRFTCHPQPIFADIEFDDDGSMILGFVDRAGHQLGAANYSTDDITPNTNIYRGLAGGDIMRAGLIGGNFVLESGGQVNGTGGCGANGQGNGGGEYYCGDFYRDHLETISGGIALLPGTGNLVATVMDPLDFWSAGVKKFNNTTGVSSEGYQVFQNDPGLSNDNIGTLGKSAGLGDLEMLCSPAPIEIGNYVWLDADADGIQDAGEIPLEGIRMELYDASGNLVAFDTTDINGQYYFSSDATDNATWLTANDELNFGTNYYIVAGGNGQFASNTLSLNGTDYDLTTANSATGTNADAIDSDGTIASGIDPDFDGEPYLQITTGSAGEVNHSYDFGFKPPATCTNPDLVSTPDTICVGGSIDISTLVTDDNNIGGTTAFYATLVEANTQSNALSATVVSPIVDTKYYVREDTTGCFDIDSIMIVVNNITASVISSDASYCSGENPSALIATTAASGDGTISYQWQSNTTSCSGTFTDISTGATSANYDPPVISMTTYYRVISTSSLGTETCKDTSNCIVLTVNPLPTATAIAISPTCPATGATPNSDGMLKLMSFPSGATYQYSTGSSFNAGSAIPASAAAIPADSLLVSNLANPATTQDYTIRVYDTNSCQIDVTVVLNNTDCSCTNPILSALTNEDICFGESFTTANITTNVTNGVSVSYQWYNNNGIDNPTTTLIAGQMTSTLTAVPTTVGSYNYQVIATNTDNSACTATQAVTLTIDGNPSATVADVLKCTSNSETIAVIPSGGTAPYTYTWSGPFGGSPPTDSIFTATNPGTYTVTVTDRNDCTSTASGEMTFQAKVCLPVSVTIKKGRRN